MTLSPPCANSVKSPTIPPVESQLDAAEALIAQLRAEKQRLTEAKATKDAELEALKVRLSVWRRRKLTD